MSSKKDMLRASARGDKDKVEALLKEGVDVNAHDKDGVSSLFLASQRGDLDIVKLLLEKGAKVDEPNINGSTPLFTSSGEGHPDVVVELIKRGANVNGVGTRGRVPLSWACYKGRMAVVTTLIDRGADVNKGSYSGDNPLMRASIGNHPNVIKVLIEKGADVNAKDEDGQTALFYAAWNNSKKALITLLENGADPNVTDNKGMTTLDLAMKYDNEDIINIMISKARKNTANENSEFLGKIKTLSKQLSSAQTKLKILEDEKEKRERETKDEIQQLRREKEELVSFRPATNQDVQELKNKLDRLSVSIRETKTVINSPVMTRNINIGTRAGGQVFNIGTGLPVELETRLREKIVELTGRIAYLELNHQRTRKNKDQEINRLKTEIEMVKGEEDAQIIH